MKQCWISYVALTASVFTLALAQTPATAPQSSAPPEEVIRINVNLVQVDAVVTDEQGHNVPDLRASDFEIKQDGKTQTITNFSYVNTRPGQVGVRTADAANTRKKNPNNAAAPPPVPLRTDQVRRTFALVVDDLGLAAENIPAVRKTLENFVDQEMQPGDLAAVLHTGRGMSALEQFTTDKRVLHAAINQIRYNSLSRIGVSSFGGGGAASGMGAAANQERRSQLNAASLGAITLIVNGLRDLPGRKTMVLFSEDLRMMTGREIDPRAEPEFQRIADAASRASVVISSIDPRGLQTLQLTAADNPSSAKQARQIPMRRSTQMFFSQDGMVRLAEATGGEFFHDRNDLSAALHQIVEEAGGYYLIAYRPAASTFDRKTGAPLFRHVSVTVKRAGLKVHSRTGFLGTPDQPVRSVSYTPQQQLIHAMVSPFSTGAIHVRMTALFSNTQKAGSFITALLYLDAHELQFEDAPDDVRKAVIDLISATFDDKGQMEEPKGETHTITLTGPEYQRALKTGFLYRFQHAVKKPGGYQMRIALRDATSLKIGSASQYVEVPDLTKGHLEMSSISLSDATGAMALTEGSGQVKHDNLLGSPGVRSFPPGTDALYAFQVLNPHLGSNNKPDLEMVTHVFRDGVAVFDSKPRTVEVLQEPDPAHIVTAGGLRLNPSMKPGDYVLQVVVTDKLADPKYAVASQWMDFEIR